MAAKVRVGGGGLRFSSASSERLQTSQHPSISPGAVLRLRLDKEGQTSLGMSVCLKCEPQKQDTGIYYHRRVVSGFPSSQNRGLGTQDRGVRLENHQVTALV